MAGADTKTTNYNLTMPAIGGSGSSWGTKLNNDLVIIDQTMQNNASSIATLTGQLAGYSLTLNTPIVSNGVYIDSQVGGIERWRIYLVDGEAETGGNAGSNFEIVRFSDSGAWLDAPLSITRSTGTVNCNDALWVGASISTNGSVNVAGNASITGSMTCSGGTATGNWVVGSKCEVNGAVCPSYTTTGGQYTLSADSNARYTYYSPYWYWAWNVSGGLLYWSTPGGPAGTQWQPFQIDIAGNVSYAGSLIHISDAAAKENIAPFEGDPLAIIAGIPVKLYNLLGKPERHLGFIAQDVQSVIPEAVMPTKDDVLGVDQNRLVAVLWGAVQKLTKRIEELEARVNRI